MRHWHSYQQTPIRVVVLYFGNYFVCDTWQSCTKALRMIPNSECENSGCDRSGGHVFVDGVGLVVANILILQGCKLERTSFLSKETHNWYQTSHITTMNLVRGALERANMFSRHLNGCLQPILLFETWLPTWCSFYPMIPARSPSFLFFI